MSAIAAPDAITESAAAANPLMRIPMYPDARSNDLRTVIPEYLDTAFFNTLERQLGAGDDFARAYVIAHEVAHHVQNELGILPKIHRMRRQVSEREANQLSFRPELQADCPSSVWAHHAAARFGSLERGDIEEALSTAARIGDDALQKRSQG